MESKASRSVLDTSMKEGVADLATVVYDETKTALARLELLKSYAARLPDDPFWTAGTNGRLVRVHGISCFLTFWFLCAHTRGPSTMRVG
jgi:hypothetical protein